MWASEPFFWQASKLLSQFEEAKWKLQMEHEEQLKSAAEESAKAIKAVEKEGTAKILEVKNDHEASRIKMSEATRQASSHPPFSASTLGPARSCLRGPHQA